MSIKAIIVSLIAVMGLLLGGICTKSLVEAWETRANADLVGRYAVVDRSLFDALFFLRGERGDSVSALRQPIEKAGLTLKTAMEKRERVIKAIEGAQQMLASFEAPILKPFTAR